MDHNPNIPKWAERIVIDSEMYGGMILWPSDTFKSNRVATKYFREQFPIQFGVVYHLNHDREFFYN